MIARWVEDSCTEDGNGYGYEDRGGGLKGECDGERVNGDQDTARKTDGMVLDHERLDVYRASLDFASWTYALCRGLKGNDRHARDQLLRASQSIALNIAEGSGRVSPGDRGRFLQIACGSARECGAVLDILGRCGVARPELLPAGKDLLIRIVAMLTKMNDRSGQVREEGEEYGNE